MMFPVVSTGLSFGNVPKYDLNTTPAPTVLSQKLNIGADGLFSFNQEAEQKAQILKIKADAILPVSREDVADEMGLLDPFREYQRERREHLTSDER